MAITYNSNDNCFYGTNAERVADDIAKYPPTSKFYEYDTGDVYICDGTQWIQM